MALQVGSEEKKKVYLAAGLGALVLILLVRFLWQTFGPSEAPPSPAPTAQVSTSRQTVPASQSAAARYPHEAYKVASESALDPTLHPEIMREAESLEYTGSGRNIFSPFSTPAVIPTAIASVRPKADLGPPQPPPPPAITLRFYGYAAERDGQKQVFLLQGDDIFIAAEGDVVDRRYRVGKIGATSVQVEDLPYHDTQSLPLMLQ